MEEGGGEKRESNEEISLLTEELIQLSVKGLRVVPNDKPTLICSIWTKKFFNPESFRAQMKSIWKTKKKFEIQLKKIWRQLWEEDPGHLVNELGDTDMIAEPIASQGKVKGGRQLASWLEGLQKQETDFNKLEIGVVNDSNMEMGNFSVASKKSS
ncbi:hypothetical protein GOBAR_AA27806 [Gossypium barbadense]|uniref:Uncharacterized protein n=1 Tax=Gossypium barbadense TaxID=3634 RepID=A0A2P5WP73_GOSBA|nr:hypothetical protein GOBAR_AA27806 [Gossypium barbadense]